MTNPKPWFRVIGDSYSKTWRMYEAEIVPIIQQHNWYGPTIVSSKQLYSSKIQVSAQIKITFNIELIGRYIDCIVCG